VAVRAHGGAVGIATAKVGTGMKVVDGLTEKGGLVVATLRAELRGTGVAPRLRWRQHRWRDDGLSADRPVGTVSGLHTCQHFLVGHCMIPVVNKAGHPDGP